MLKNRWAMAIMAMTTKFFLFFATVYAADSMDTRSEQTLHIDVPVKLEKANVVFNIDHLALFGDMPFPIAHLNILNNNFKEWNVKGQIIAIFHSDAGYVMLNDKAYNAFRNVNTGNPFREILVNLMNQGVQIELCGATAKAYHWVNDNLIPGVKVNTNAMVRLIQLGEEGYIQL